MTAPAPDSNRLHLHMQPNGTCRLSAHGQSWMMEFQEMEAALDHARVFSVEGQTRLTVYDACGQPIIETFA